MKAIVQHPVAFGHIAHQLIGHDLSADVSTLPVGLELEVLAASWAPSSLPCGDPIHIEVQWTDTHRRVGTFGTAHYPVDHLRLIPETEMERRLLRATFLERQAAIYKQYGIEDTV